MRIKKPPLLIFILLVLSSCVEEFWPEINQHDSQILVVDGLMTNKPGPYTVKLSRTSTIDSSMFLPVTGFELTIVDDQGNFETLTETALGTYSTSAGGIQGVIGRKYKLEIHDSEGNFYQTEFETLLPPVEIKSLYGDIQTQETTEGNNDIYGYQFYIDTEEAAADSTYLLWKLEQTYEYHSDFSADYILEAGAWELRMLHIDEAAPYKTCWLTEKVPEIFTYSTTNLSSAFVNKFPLHFVTTNTRELSVRYSLLAKQYTISAKAYKFWNNVQYLNSNQGSLYTRQPNQIRGNIYNADDPDDVILGYFMVAGESEKRTFVNRLPDPYKYYYDICFLVDVDTKRAGEVLSNVSMYQSQLPLLFYYYGGKFGVTLPAQSCIDCRLKGGVNVKPDFWTDH